MRKSGERPEFRLARTDDIPFILELVRELCRKTGLNDRYGIPFDGASAILTIGGVLANGLCLVGKSSCAGAVFFPYPYNHAAKIAHVQFWYFRNAREIAIFEALADACKGAGATHIYAASIPPRHTVGKWYRKKGLSECESEHIGQLI